MVSSPSHSLDHLTLQTWTGGQETRHKPKYIYCFETQLSSRIPCTLFVSAAFVVRICISIRLTFEADNSDETFATTFTTFTQGHTLHLKGSRPVIPRLMSWTLGDHLYRKLPIVQYNKKRGTFRKVDKLQSDYPSLEKCRIKWFAALWRVGKPHFIALLLRLCWTAKNSKRNNFLLIQQPLNGFETVFRMWTVLSIAYKVRESDNCRKFAWSSYGARSARWLNEINRLPMIVILVNHQFLFVLVDCL